MKKIFVQSGKKLSSTVCLSNTKESCKGSGCGFNSRADAYDRYIDEITRLENIEGIKKANKENIQLAQAIKFIVGKKAQLLINKIKDAGNDINSLDDIINELSWNVLPQLANMAVEVERKAYGMNDEILRISLGNNTGNDIELSFVLKSMS